MDSMKIAQIIGTEFTQATASAILQVQFYPKWNSFNMLIIYSVAE